MPVPDTAGRPNTVTSFSRRDPASRRASRSLPKDPVLGQVRIIIGQWRGRKLAVPAVNGLRPTGDRVRETVFNWLQSHIAGAHCLDLFAGSGALGFEALSRYAKSTTFVENSATALSHIEQSCKLLDVETAGIRPVSEAGAERREWGAHLYAGTAQNALSALAKASVVPRFDVVFIDPPFEAACQWSVLQALVPGLLADDARVYVEAPLGQPIPDSLPAGCAIAKEKRMGEVIVRLVSFCKSI